MYQTLLRTNLLGCLLLFSFTLTAQESTSLAQKYPKNAKVLYQTIQLEKEIGKVVVNLEKEQVFEYEYWQGDAILVEQEIHLENAPNSVFRELMQKKRYDIVEMLQENTLVLEYENVVRKALLVNYKDANEKVFLRLLIPEKIAVELNKKT
ncbi:MAG: hypothetical protein AAF960_19655 [Bacteroidota bacterium]